MRAYIDSIGRALSVPARRDLPRVPRSMRPRVGRSTFVPVRQESSARGLSRAA